MAINEAGAAGIPELESGLILSNPDDSIFDSIFDWIANAVDKITGGVTDQVIRVINAVGDNSVRVINAIGNIAPPIIQAISSGTASVINEVSIGASSVIYRLGNQFTNVISAVSAGASRVIGTVSSGLSNIIGSVSAGISQVVSSVSSGLSNIIGSVTSGVSHIIGSVSAGISQVIGAVGSAGSMIINAVSGLIGAIGNEIRANLAWITNFLKVEIPAIMGSWFDTFVGKILDFPAWIGKFFDAISAWFSVDIPGHSPRWTSIFEGIGHWFATWFYEFPKWFFGDLPENVAYGLAASWDWFTRGLNPIVSAFMDALIGYTAQLGAIHPDHATQHYSSLITAGATAVFGLVGMTIAGELLHPLKNLGLGNIAAMIFDLTNYKMLTGAFMTALGTAAIGLPMRWYYYRLFRPSLPSIRDGMDFYASDDIDLAAFKEFLGFHGIPDGWHDAYADSSYRAPSPYQLQIAAESGAIDEETMATELRRAGYHPKVRQLYLDAFRKAAGGQLKAIMVTSATGRYKKGYSDKAGLEAELRLLNVGDAQIPGYIAGAQLDYATAFLDDLVDAYTYSVRGGTISLETYRTDLLALGIQPDRVAQYVLRERARIKPKEQLTQIGTPEKIYLTDQGKIRLDTIRKRRQKYLITRSEELVQLGNLGLDTDYATAIADNDDAILLDKEELKPPKVIPMYQTAAGKVKLDTIRDTRRKNTIDRGEELTQLAALGVPDYLATAYADNDDVAIQEKIPTEEAPAPAPYETEAGKIQVDTIRRQRRKSTIDRDGEINALAELGMPDWLVQAVVENDDARMAEKGGGE